MVRTMGEVEWENGIDIGVDIILFDAEDNGESGSQNEYSNETWCLGSQHWGKNPHKSGYKANYGILLDMVGAKGARFPFEGHSVSSPAGKAVVDKDHYFVTKYRNFPMIDIINLSEKTSQSFGDHHHTHDDNIDVIDKRVLKAVGRVVTAMVYRENNQMLGR